MASLSVAHRVMFGIQIGVLSLGIFWYGKYRLIISDWMRPWDTLSDTLQWCPLSGVRCQLSYCLSIPALTRTSKLLQSTNILLLDSSITRLHSWKTETMHSCCLITCVLNIESFPFQTFYSFFCIHRIFRVKMASIIQTLSKLGWLP